MRVQPKPSLLGLLEDRRLRERIQTAARMGASTQMIGSVTFASDWRHLGELAALNPGSPAVIDTRFEGALRSNGRARQLLHGHQSSPPVIWYGRCVQACEGRLIQAGMNVEAHLIPGVDDHFEGIDRAILRSIDAQRVRRLRERLKRAAGTEGFTIFNHALDLAIGPSSVPALAELVGRTRRSLERRCAVLGMPSPNTLLLLGRIYTVQRLAEWSRQPVGCIARALGFSAPSNYRRMVRAIFGCAPSVIQRLGGSDYVARVIVHRLG